MMAVGSNSGQLSRKRFVIRAVVDSICVCVVASPILILFVAVDPFHRGFFCDDQSLMHPYKEDTIPTWLMVVVGFSLPLATISLLEFLLYRKKCCCVPVLMEVPAAQRTGVGVCYRIIMTLLFGAATTQLITDIAKYSVGRLRPHFLVVCRPLNVPSNCSGFFITEDLCTGDTAIIKEARLSFPSGHASLGMYLACFLMVYLQARLVCRQVRLLRSVLQVGVFLLAYFTSLSRVFDYKHHWNDVLGGVLMGIVICYVIVVFMSDFHRMSFRHTGPSHSGLQSEQVPLYVKANSTSMSSQESVVQMHVDQKL